jgi:cyanophycin synthetase
MNELIKINTTAKVVKGFLYGLHYPSLLVEITVNDQELDDAKFNVVKINFIKMLRLDEGVKQLNLIDFILTCLHGVQLLVNWPVCDKPYLMRSDSGKYHLAIPTLKNRHTQIGKLTTILLKLLNELLSHYDHKKTLNDFGALIKELKKYSPAGSNLQNFIKTSHALKIPFTQIVDDLYQYGYGSESIWMESSFTEKTSNFSSKLARNKNITSQVLNSYGVPVPRNRIINNIDEAKDFFLKVGFPVVVKPADLDGGVGVSINLSTEQEVNDAFEKTSKYSKKILIEEHVSGKDYRLVVFNGRLIWAIERIPAHIVGNGQLPIQDLIDEENKNKHRKSSSDAPLKPLKLDKESLALLAKKGLTPQSVPLDGQLVFLRQHANIAAGGTPVGVFEKVHPDNARLAIRATEALRLDLAGIDLLIPDIAKSWKETGGFICEVNAQPVLGSLTSMHVYSEILNELLPNGGRIPIVLILGEKAKLDCFDGLAELAGISVGLIDDSQINVGLESINGKCFPFDSAGTAITRNKNVNCIVMKINEERLLSNGLPFDYIDTLILLDDYEENSTQPKFIEAILPMITNSIVVVNKKTKVLFKDYQSKVDVEYVAMDELTTYLQKLITESCVKSK